MNQYMKATDLYTEASRRLGELSALYERKKKSLSRMPRGTLYVRKNKKRVQYYLLLEGKETYLRKEDEGRIKLYLQKSYDEKILRLLGKEIAALTTFLNKQPNATAAIQMAYSSNPQEIKSCIVPIDLSDEEYAEQWKGQPYETKANDKEACIFLTERGEKVRSKSELNIANALHRHGIPYRYECLLVLNNGMKIYPDFTVLDIVKRRLVYWEHRGMMDDKEYAEHAVARLKDYAKNNIRLGKNLIITEETRRQPLGMDEIGSLIQEYFRLG